MTEKEVIKKCLSEDNQRIAKTRQLSSPTEVHLGHKPPWLRKRLLAAKKANPKSVAACFYTEFFRAGYWDLGWLDHWGSTTLPDGRPAFVVEPYAVNSKQLKEVEDIAEACGCYSFVSANSWWNPGRTLRLVITPKPETLP